MRQVYPLRGGRRRRRSIAIAEWRLAILGGVLLGLVAAGWRPPELSVPWAGSGAPVAAEAPPVLARFGLCDAGGGRNCVVDGDTFRLEGEKIRIADIDAPETHPPRCAHEADLGERATRRLQALLNAGPVTLESEGRDTDRYGRALRIVRRDGESIGAMLVDEGLARRWTGARRPWC